MVPVLSIAVTSCKHKFVVFIAKLCLERIVDQDIAGADNCAHAASEILSADREGQCL